MCARELAITGVGPPSPLAPVLARSGPTKHTRREMGSTQSKATATGAVVGAAVGAVFSGVGAAVVLTCVVGKAASVVVKNVTDAFNAGGRVRAQSTSVRAVVATAVGAVSSCAFGPVGATIAGSVMAVKSTAQNVDPPKDKEEREETRMLHSFAKIALCTTAGVFLRPYVGVTLDNVIEVERWGAQAAIPALLGFVYEAIFDMPLGGDFQTLMGSQMLATFCFNFVPFVWTYSSMLGGAGFAVVLGMANSIFPVFLSFMSINAFSIPLCDYAKEKRQRELLETFYRLAKELKAELTLTGDNTVTRKIVEAFYEKKVEAAILHSER